MQLVRNYRTALKHDFVKKVELADLRVSGGLECLPFAEACQACKRPIRFVYHQIKEDIEMRNAADDDEEYFSSLASTSLANVFMKINVGDTATDNTSLNYVPVKPKQEASETKCVFTRFFTAFEWSNSNYVSKGKVGLAIIKDVQYDSYKILIYDASKSPLCYIDVTPTFNVKVKNAQYIYFYDDAQKYWMLHSNFKDIEETANEFKKLGVVLVQISEEVEEFKITDNVSKNPGDRESDTDSSANQQNKEAILKRMANMGQAILPTFKTSKAPKNYSSDEGRSDLKPIHKSNRIKLNTKSFPKTIPLSKDNSGINDIEPASDDVSNSQISKANICIPNNSQNENLHTLMDEQRIVNSELRINLGRISDKVDAAIKNITDLKQNCNMEFLVEVYRKLLNEYEIKIKVLEKTNQLKEFDATVPNDQLITSLNANQDVVRNLETEIIRLHRIIQEKETQIFNLETEIKRISIDLKKEQLNNNPITQIDDLKQMIQNLNVGIQQKPLYTQEQVKEMMNELFHCVSSELDDNSNYTDEHIKKLVGTSIKKVTFEMLNNK